ncbi:MAG: arginase [Gammaproteobacteria bacterium]|nr:arginase [Gammaproteobacteria bacterium]MBT7877992.1 arginase [Gammaproteobacteria bacterium]
MTKKLTSRPGNHGRTFLNFPFTSDLDELEADFALLGIPCGMPYEPLSIANDQSTAPDIIRNAPTMADIEYTKNHFDWDLGGPLLASKDVRIVDCGNVNVDAEDYKAHYHDAQLAAEKILSSGAMLIALGGDHGVSIPVMGALKVLGESITLVHVDAHLDWRHEINGETLGYSSPIRRASEMPWIKHIVQIGLRGIGSAREAEVEDALTYGADLISAYELHDIGMQAVLDRIPGQGPFYLTIDADGLDPTIMPAVMAQTPGGLNWVQTWKLIHGLVNKGRVVGMDLVEIAPKNDIGGITAIHAERLICNFIGASIRAGHCD